MLQYCLIDDVKKSDDVNQTEKYWLSSGEAGSDCPHDTRIKLFRRRRGLSGGTHFLGFRPLAALADFEGNALTFGQKSFGGVDVGNMDEEIIATVVGVDKAKTFLLIEEFNGTCGHFCFPFVFCGLHRETTIISVGGNTLLI